MIRKMIRWGIALAWTMQAVTAQGLEAGSCGQIDAVLAELKVAGQQLVATGTGMAEGPLEARPQRVSILFLVDPKSRGGYILQTDKPLNLGAASLCVRNRLEAVRLYDPWLPGIRNDSLVRTTEAEASLGCAPVLADEYVLQGCEWLNSLLLRSEDGSQRLLLQGHDVKITGDRSDERAANLLTVMIRDPAKAGPESLSFAYLYSSTPDGATTLSRIFNDAEITLDGERLVTEMEAASSNRVDGHEIGARGARDPLLTLPR